MVGRGLPHARGGYRPQHRRHGRKLPGNTPAKAGINEQVTPWVLHHGSGPPSTLIEMALPSPQNVCNIRLVCSSIKCAVSVSGGRPPLHCRPKRGLREMIVATSKIDETLLISIERPPVNALDLDAIAELKQAFATAAREMPQGGVVLTGGGDVFSAGVDTRAFASYSGEQRQAMVQAITHMVAQLLAIPVPVVAA